MYSEATVALTLYYHPLSSYCWKALIALYEADVAFEPRMVNLGDPADRAALAAVWPLAKFPVLRDDELDRTVPEATIVIEYLAQHYPSAASLVPASPDLAWQTRLRDRLFDNYIHNGLQRVVADRLRAEGQRDPLEVDRARADIRAGYDLVQPMGTDAWAMGETFTLADCAALPALFYADYAVSLAEWPKLAAYLGRLKARPSVARVLAEAGPYFQYFPLKDG
ncbi:glutathione S-transferase family protein [Phenylobacterium sp.]|uniref:glutathione S-transferase family protein n=1 Tax=Phenylobacterium sp. TaxID=1871053 RepID=UPI002F3F8748